MYAVLFLYLDQFFETAMVGTPNSEMVSYSLSA